MLKALLWKEWRQLRALRWVGACLGLLAPFVGMAATTAAGRGWIPFADIGSGYEATEVFAGALPAALGGGLWPLVALLMTSQSFAGDRSTGNESFLLEQPVPRGKIWLARLVASWGSTVLVALGTLAIWAVITWATVGEAINDWSWASRAFGLVGPLVTFICLLGGTLAASLLSAPLAATLLGLILAVVPAMLFSWLGGLFRFATFRGVPVAVVVPALLLVAYPLGSLLSVCRGEPAGRGRIGRGSLTVAAGFAAGVVLFLVLAPVSLRLRAMEGDDNITVFPSVTGGTAYVASGQGYSGGWMVDLEAAETIRFFPPSVGSVAWSPDGRTLAMVDYSGPLGSERTAGRIEFYDRAGRATADAIRLPDGLWVRDLRWAGDRVVTKAFSMGRSGTLLVASPETGAIGVVSADLHWWNWALVGPTSDGRVFLAAHEAGAREDEEEEEESARPYTVRRIDPERGIVTEDVLVEDVGAPFRADGRLSPSGRYWILDRSAGWDEERPVLDLETGEETRVPVSIGHASWLPDDTLLWLERSGERTRLGTVRAGAEPTLLREWSGYHVSAAVSPDGRRILVIANRILEGQRTLANGEVIPVRQERVETQVYETGDGTWTPTPDWPGVPWEVSGYRTLWAGPRTLAHEGPGVLGLESLDRPGDVRYVFGKEPS